MTDYRYWETNREQIIAHVKRKLDHLFPSPTVCKFHAVCKGYHKEHYTCQHEDEAKFHCGYYKQHKAATLMGDMSKLMEGTEFSDFDV
jgi:hypothetical protein